MPILAAVPHSYILAPAQLDLDLDRNGRKLGMVPPNISVVLIIHLFCIWLGGVPTIDV